MAPALTESRQSALVRRLNRIRRRKMVAAQLAAQEAAAAKLAAEITANADKTCVICFEDAKSPYGIWGECGHAFDYLCALAAFCTPRLNSHKCPTCNGGNFVGGPVFRKDIPSEGWSFKAWKRVTENEVMAVHKRRPSRFAPLNRADPSIGFPPYPLTTPPTPAPQPGFYVPRFPLPQQNDESVNNAMAVPTENLRNLPEILAELPSILPHVMPAEGASLPIGIANLPNANEQSIENVPNLPEILPETTLLHIMQPATDPRLLFGIRSQRSESN